MGWSSWAARHGLFEKYGFLELLGAVFSKEFIRTLAEAFSARYRSPNPR